MGNPLFKASEGGGFDVSRVGKDVIESEVRQVSEMKVLIRLKVYPAASPTRRRGKESLLIRRDATPEPFSTGPPMSVLQDYQLAGIGNTVLICGKYRKHRIVSCVQP